MTSPLIYVPTLDEDDPTWCEACQAYHHDGCPIDELELDPYESNNTHDRDYNE